MVGSITILPPNMPPLVSITNPQDGAKFTIGANILIEANASDDSAVTRVEFFESGNLIATDFDAPYSTSLTNVALGNYSLTATVFDAEGLFTTSTAVNISALNTPTIIITHPTEGAKFRLGTNVFIAADVTVAGLAVTSIQFFESDGTDFQAISPSLTDAPYNFLWSPVTAGTHSLRAVVTDEAGGTTASALVNIEVFDPGTENPTIAITNAPPNFSRATNSTLPISGIAADDIRLDYVEFQVNGGPFLRANGTNNWIAQVGLVAGTNVINFRSVDFAGNFSTNDTRTLIYVLNSPTVLVRGLGTVKPNLDGKVLELGKFYQMIARPGAGQIFGGWSGTTNSNKAVLNFPMDSNLVLIASFIPNPFPNVKGIYTGLIFETNNVRPETSGSFKLNVTSRGTFSGRLTIQNKNYPLHGQFDYSGFVRFPVLRSPRLPAVITLNLDLLGANGISGAVTSAIVTLVTNDSTTIETTHNGWGSVLHGNRMVSVPEFNSGLRNRELRFDLKSGEENFGSGVIHFNATRILGRLSSGELLNQTLFLSQNGQIPFYSSLNNGDTVLFGWLTLQNSLPPSVSGELVFGTTNGFSSLVDFVPAEEAAAQIAK
jgi:hypothetical protein